MDAAVRKAYEGLGGSVPVAVRSSATAEDLPFASFAGQQDSFLDVTGADAVVEAVRRCWASLWTERAVAYRSANGISNRDVGLAVVVQVMVDAATAGVLFTANPVTGTRTETVINASPGTGQAVVSGGGQPGPVRRWRRRPPGSRCVPREGRNPGGRPSLDGPRLQELTALGDGVQRLFGAPQDIEWAIDAGGKIWLTQSRPITTLYPLPEPAPEDAAAGAAAPHPGVPVRHPVPGADPADHAAWGCPSLRSMRNSKGPWRYVNPGLRMYVDLTAVVRSKSGRGYLLRMLPAGGRQVRRRASGAAGGSEVRHHRALVPGIRPQRRAKAQPPATARRRTGSTEQTSQPRPHGRAHSGHVPARFPAGR